MKKNLMLCWLGAASVHALSASATFAQVRQLAEDAAPASDDIVVTATKTGERSLQKVPLAVTAFSGEAVAVRGAVSLATVASFTPGFSYTFNGIWSVASIRGVGTNNVFAGGDPSTTLQVDGVYFGRPTGANLDFLDIDRVEVLRGPQGTLYGRNAIGGTVNVITRDPGDSFRGQVRLTLGDYGLVRPEASVSGPLGEKVAFSLSGRYSRRNGYIDELTPQQKDLWNENRHAARGKLKFTPSDDLLIVLAADYSRSRERINGFNIRLSPVLVPDGYDPGFFEGAVSAPNRGNLRQWGISSTVRLDLGSATLTSITAYRKANAALEGDLDFTALDLFHTRAFVERQNQVSQEFDLSGTLGDATYVVGLYGYRERARSFFNAVVFGTLLTQGINAVTKSGAVFGQADYPIADGFKVTVGARYTIDHKSAANIFGIQFTGVTPDLNQQAAGTGPIFAGDNSRHAFTPKLGVEYQVDPDTLTYASVTRGFKSGGYNLLVDPTTIGEAEYGPEHVWAYEAGLKLGFPAVRGRLNLAAFYYDYTGLQVNQFKFVGTTVSQFVNNAKAADIKGIEAEWSLRLLPVVELGGTAAYLDAKYKGAFPALDNFTNIATNPDGRRLNDAPRLSGSGYIQIDHSFGGIDAHLRGDAIYKSRVYYTPLNDIRLGSRAHWRFNAGLAIVPRESGAELGVRVDNITNRKYITATYYAFSAGGQAGEPRTIRGYVSYKF